MRKKLNADYIIKQYNEGMSLNEIARRLHSYPMSISRVLERYGVTLRHDTYEKGSLHVEGGEELIEWAKAQGRLVTKTELAEVAGKHKLSPSYLEKYPELNKYIKTYSYIDVQDYYQRLYNWLDEHNIPYKPNDRTRLKFSVTALLLESYSNIILHISKKPKYVSVKEHQESLEARRLRALSADIKIFFIDEEELTKLEAGESEINKFLEKINT